MAYKTANDLIQMFTDRKQLKWIVPSGDAWAQRNGSQTASFWISRKQADWVLGVYDKEFHIPTASSEAEGTIFIAGHKVKWQLHQTSKRSNNGAGMVKLAR